MGDLRGISDSQGNIGNIHFGKGDYNEASLYFDNSLMIKKEMRDRRGMARAKFNRGKVYVAQNEHVQAIDFGNRAMPLAQAVGDVTITEDIAKMLYKSYKATHQYKLALSMQTSLSLGN